MDPYSTLGVSKTASQDEIKKAYRRMAMEFHPDRNDSAGAEEKFKNASEAYSKIGTEESRRRYEAEMAQGGSFNDFFHDFGAHGHSWEDMFGSFQQRARTRPFIIRAQMDATLEDIYQGVHKTFELDGQSVSFKRQCLATESMKLIVQIRELRV